VNTGEEKDGQSRLFRIPETSATSMHAEKRLTADGRAELIGGLVAAEPNEPWVIWVDTDYEADAVQRCVPEALEVRGSMSPEEKEDRIIAFSEGKARILISKSSITGFGLNWQHCARMAFVGVTDSFEAYYQALRRCWRFGQQREVEVHIFASELEGSVIANLSRKERDAVAMSDAMSVETHDAVMASVRATARQSNPYQPGRRIELPDFMRAA
jgi:hypothetical protein